MAFAAGRVREPQGKLYQVARGRHPETLAHFPQRPSSAALSALKWHLLSANHLTSWLCAAGRVQEPAEKPGPGGKGKASRKERVRAKKEAKKLARQADSDDDDLGIAGMSVCPESPSAWRTSFNTLSSLPVVPEVCGHWPAFRRGRAKVMSLLCML